MAYLLGLSLVACHAPATGEIVAKERKLNTAMTGADRMEELQYFVGSWLARAEDPSTGRSFTLRYEAKPTLDNAWLTGYGESQELGVRVQDFWGRDPASGEIMRVIFDNQATYATVRSAGWKGDTLLLEGESQTKSGAVPVRETITRLGPNEFRAVWEARLEKGWATYSVEHLSRKSPP